MIRISTLKIQPQKFDTLLLRKLRRLQQSPTDLSWWDFLGFISITKDDALIAIKKNENLSMNGGDLH